jgi:hypothetical protein
MKTVGLSNHSSVTPIIRKNYSNKHGLVRKARQDEICKRNAAALFGRSKTWTYRLIYAGVIHPLKSTPTLMIPRSEVDRLLANTGKYTGKIAKADETE